MPIHEFICEKCQHEFEYLVLSANEPAPKCPRCNSNKLQKAHVCGMRKTSWNPHRFGRICTAQMRTIRQLRRMTFLLRLSKNDDVAKGSISALRGIP